MKTICKWLGAWSSHEWEIRRKLRILLACMLPDLKLRLWSLDLVLPWGKRAFMNALPQKWQPRLFNKICSIFLLRKNFSYLLMVPPYLLGMGAVSGYVYTSLIWSTSSSWSLTLGMNMEFGEDKESLRAYWKVRFNIVIFMCSEQSLEVGFFLRRKAANPCSLQRFHGGVTLALTETSKCSEATGCQLYAEQLKC